MAKVITSVVIFHSILESILGRFIRVGGGRTAIPGLVRTAEDGGEEGEEEGNNLGKKAGLNTPETMVGPVGRDRTLAVKSRKNTGKYALFL